ncbi:MAG: hypothetical protein HRJ53_12280 [Acidobacteria bacterium Pan2503]|uniref:Uncharacterized protein n=1 Tax=Candidatus Acidiferrum panamense TaxID=2741543 RepID=A0A7V8NQT3_9BACT|nr:hypothetical protein [Candidatus Acidoferrum panamensis]
MQPQKRRHEGILKGVLGIFFVAQYCFRLTQEFPTGGHKHFFESLLRLLKLRKTFACARGWPASFQAEVSACSTKFGGALEYRAAGPLETIHRFSHREHHLT